MNLIRGRLEYGEQRLTEQWKAEPNQTKTKHETTHMDNVTAPAKTRVRRTEEQRIADLQAEMESLRQKQTQRQAGKVLENSDEGQATILAVRALDRGIRIATKNGDREMLHTLEAARAPLGTFAAHRFGIRIAEPRLKVGGRTRKQPAS